MNDDTLTAPTKPQAPEQASQVKSHEQNDTPLSRTEKKVVSKLRDQVDDRGNYGKLLDNITLGYVAGKGAEMAEFDDAREQIKSMFEKDMGIDIQSYLEDDRIARGKSVDRDR